jgi:hypothetical protein
MSWEGSARHLLDCPCAMLAPRAPSLGANNAFWNNFDLVIFFTYL